MTTLSMSRDEQVREQKLRIKCEPAEPQSSARIHRAIRTEKSIVIKIIKETEKSYQLSNK